MRDVKIALVMIFLCAIVFLFKMNLANLEICSKCEKTVCFYFNNKLGTVCSVYFCRQKQSKLHHCPLVSISETSPKK